jgi:hypothetical protein
LIHTQKKTEEKEVETAHFANVSIIYFIFIENSHNAYDSSQHLRIIYAYTAGTIKQKIVIDNLPQKHTITTNPYRLFYSINWLSDPK